jgi:hypothetical protein
MTGRLSFKLWRRNKVANLKKYLSNHNLLSRVNATTSLVIAIVGIYFALIANKIGKRSNEIAEIQLKMQTTDTSQQSQINKLTEIIEELKVEHLTSGKIYSTTDKLNQSTKIQLDVINQQLKLAKRLESKADSSNTTEQSANMLSIIVAFNTLFDFKSSADAYFLDRRAISTRSQSVSRIRQLLENQLQNKYVLENSYLRYIWFEFYLYVSNLEFEFNMYDLGTRESIRNDAEHNILAKHFSEKYMAFLNKMLKPKNEFLSLYINKAKNEFEKNPTFKYR